MGFQIWPLQVQFQLPRTVRREWLQSITASRISNLFDFYGPAYTIDAACASSLAAVICGITGLLRKDYDVLITGGVDVDTG